MLIGTETHRGTRGVSGNISQGLELAVPHRPSQLHVQVVLHGALLLSQRRQNSLAGAAFIAPRLFISAADFELRQVNTL